MKPNKNMTKEEAIALASTKWWEELSVEEAFKAQAKSPLMAMPFDEFHRITELALGRPVWTHEFADIDSLLSELDKETPKPEDLNQHAIDSLASLLLSQGRDPDKVIIPIDLTEK